jgi:hypothetical protein
MSNKEITECFAVRGKTMIDTIDSETGLTNIYGKTLEAVRAEPKYSNAERMTIDEYCESKAAAQDTPITWEPTTEERYWEMLECLPPAAYIVEGFLVGEPYDHHATTGQPRYEAFIKRNGQYLHASRPMRKSEFLSIAKGKV